MTHDYAAPESKAPLTVWGAGPPMPLVGRVGVTSAAGGDLQSLDFSVGQRPPGAGLQTKVAKGADRDAT